MAVRSAPRARPHRVRPNSAVAPMTGVALRPGPASRPLPVTCTAGGRRTTEVVLRSAPGGLSFAHAVRDGERCSSCRAQRCERDGHRTPALYRAHERVELAALALVDAYA